MTIPKEEFDSVHYVKGDNCNECLHFCWEVRSRGGQIEEDKNWCDKTGASVHPYATACEKFIRSLHAGVKWARRGKE